MQRRGIFHPQKTVTCRNLELGHTPHALGHGRSCGEAVLLRPGTQPPASERGGGRWEQLFPIAIFCAALTPSFVGPEQGLHDIQNSVPVKRRLFY